MTDKNEEIARELYEQIEDMTSAPIPVDCKKIIHEALDQKDRDHEALIGVLVGSLQRVISMCDQYPDDWDISKVADEALSHPIVQEYLKKEKI